MGNIAFSHRKLDLISFDSHNAAFIIPIPCGSGAADHCEARAFQFLGQRIDLFFAANTESDMGIPGAVQGFLLIRLYASSSIPMFSTANTIK